MITYRVVGTIDMLPHSTRCGNFKMYLFFVSIVMDQLMHDNYNLSHSSLPLDSSLVHSGVLFLPSEWS